MARSMRLSKADANALNKVVAGRTAKTSSGAFGTICRLTRGGVQVQFSIAGRPKTYPLYESFAKGDIALTDPILQGRVMAALNQLAARAGLGENGSGIVDGLAAEKESAKARHGGEKVNATEEVRIADNAKMLCSLKGISRDAFQWHMSGLGIDGFDESISTGFAGRQPYVALKEAARYLGYSADELLASPNRLLELLFKACSPTNHWTRGRATESMGGDGILVRRVSFNSVGGTVEVGICAFHTSERVDKSTCDLIVCVLSDRTRSPKTVTRIEYSVPNPSNSNVQRFNLAYKRAAGDGERTNAASVTKTGVAVQSGNGARDRAPDVTTTYPKSDVRPTAKPIHVNEFLVRKAYGRHRQNGHRLDSVRATVLILPKTGGDPRPVEFDAYWCPKCRKYYMTEGTFLRLKRQGYICCKVVEEKDLGTKKVGEGVYGKLASESILHMYGYTVNQQDDLTERERQTIISFVIENRIQSAQEIAHLLEWLISQREGNSRMAVAVSRWKADLSFVRHYHKPTRKVRVDRIYAKL